MNYKKQIVSIMTLAILLLLMMSTVMQAVSLVESIGDFKAVMNGSQMKLTWASVSNSAGYNVYVNGTKIGSVNSNEASLIGFTENTTYRLRVTAYDHAKMEVATSNEINFTTTTNQTNLGQVQNLTVTQANGYVTLNWSSVNNANKYQVFVDVPGFGNVNIGEVTTTNAMLKGFSNGMRYGFSVRACQTLNADNVSYGAKSVAQYITIDFNKDDTNNDNNNNNNNGTKPDKVTNVTAYNIAETMADVSWAVANNADGYEVLLSKNYGSYAKVYDTTKNAVRLGNLSANSYYRVKVVAYKWINKNKVYGEESAYTFFTTKEEKVVVGDISRIDVYNVTEKEATIAWTKANNADGYEIDLAKNNGKYQTIYDTTKTQAVLGNLDADSKYSVRVIAYKWVNGKKQYGNISYVKSFYTQEEQITVGSVKNIYIDKVTQNSVDISWSSVNGAQGYYVSLAEGNGTFKFYGDTAGRKYVLANLKADTYYRVRVIAYKIVNGKEYTSEQIAVQGFTTLRANSNVANVPQVTGLNANVKRTTVRLSWNRANNVAGYEIEFTVPGIGRIPYYTTNNYIDISGITGKQYNYTARVRAYKYVNGVKKYGEYSNMVSFREN
ncbi:MAG: fibronectin type III domain-containing protein [Clostridia bacterium]|nr:fibronectin type III domain-containing protein [Clostridia bacterium]